MASSQQQNNSSIPTITITKTETIYPKNKYPNTILNLSNLDRQCPALMYLVSFYMPSSSNEKIPVFQGLKSGLEETLSIWFPAAGRLCYNQNGEMNLWCNNEGAILAEAMTKVKISELGDLSQYKEFFENLVFKPIFSSDFSDMPLVVAQVTKFGCGGYSIGIGTSHSLFDGPSAFNFLQVWSSNTSKFLHKNTNFTQFQKPVLEKDQLLVKIGPRKVKIRVLAIEHLYQLIQSQAANTNLCPKNKFENPLVFKTFHVSGEIIENLKKKIISQGRGDFSCSSFEVVTSHLWKAKVKALGKKKETMVCLQFSMDIRNKILPPLPSGFTGNAYVLASVSLLAAELEEGTPEFIIQKIKQAKNSVNADYVYAYMEALNGPPQVALPPMNELTMVSDWTKMPFHKVDFLGHADYVSPLVSPTPDVVYLMQNPNNAKGIDVRVGLPSDVLDAFSSYFLNLNENMHLGGLIVLCKGLATLWIK